MFKFPLRIPENRCVILTQGFRSTELAEFYRSKGLNYPVHTAIDVICGTSLETYGTPFVCPFPWAELVAADEAAYPGAKGSRVQVKYEEPGGDTWVIGGLHFSDLEDHPLGYRFAEGETIAYLGNSGAVYPEPVPEKAHQGAHLHFTVVLNGTIVDPVLYFDLLTPFRGEDTGFDKDVPALQWAIWKVREQVALLVARFKGGV